MTITPNDLKKGDIVRMNHGGDAVIADNKSGSIRMITVSTQWGPETGSCYVDDFAFAQFPHRTIELTPAMLKNSAARAQAGF
jgi:hypothetical protein